MKRVMDDLITAVYKVESRGETSALMVKKAPKNKHGLVFLCTFWFTLGIGNLIYALLPSKNDDKVMLKIDN